MSVDLSYPYAAYYQVVLQGSLQNKAIFLGLIIWTALYALEPQIAWIPIYEGNFIKHTRKCKRRKLLSVDSATDTNIEEKIIISVLQCGIEL